MKKYLLSILEKNKKTVKEDIEKTENEDMKTFLEGYLKGIESAMYEIKEVV
jgi:hypothetical protein